MAILQNCSLLVRTRCHLCMSSRTLPAAIQLFRLILVLVFCDVGLQCVFVVPSLSWYPEVVRYARIRRAAGSKEEEPCVDINRDRVTKNPRRIASTVTAALDAITCRREALIFGAAAVLAASKACKAVVPTSPVCVTELHRLRPSPGQVGGRLSSVTASIGGTKTEMMLDTGLTSAMVTPAFAQSLNLKRVGVRQGDTASGSQQVELVKLGDAVLPCGEKLPPVIAAVANLPVASTDPAISIGGMLGFGALGAYDVDIDFPESVLRLWHRGDGAIAARQAGLCRVEGTLLPEYGVLGVRVLKPQGNGLAAALGIIDTGATFSVVNTDAANSLGISTKEGARELKILGVGDEPLYLKISTGVPLPLGGRGRDDGLGWDTAVTVNLDNVAVGDMPALASLGGGKPAVLLGLDILSTRRLVITAEKNGPGLEHNLYMGR